MLWDRPNGTQERTASDAAQLSLPRPWNRSLADKETDYGIRRDPHLGKETYLVRQDRRTPLSKPSPISSSAQSAESARLQRFTFNALNFCEIVVATVGAHSGVPNYHSRIRRSARSPSRSRRRADPHVRLSATS